MAQQKLSVSFSINADSAQAQKALADLKRQLDVLGATNVKLPDVTGGAAAKADAAALSLGRMAKGVAGITLLGVGISAVADGLGKVAAFSVDSVKKFEDNARAMNKLASLAKAYGFNVSEVIALNKELASTGLITQDQTAEMLGNFIQGGADTVTNLKRVADAYINVSAASRQAGLSIGEAAAGAATGWRTGNNERFDNAGFQENISKVYERQAAAINKTTDALSAKERWDAMSKYAVNESNKVLGAAAREMENLTGKTDKLTASLELLQRNLGKALKPAVSGTASLAQRTVEGVTLMLGLTDEQQQQQEAEKEARRIQAQVKERERRKAQQQANALADGGRINLGLTAAPGAPTINANDPRIVGQGGAKTPTLFGLPIPGLPPDANRYAGDVGKPLPAITTGLQDVADTALTAEQRVAAVEARIKQLQASSQAADKQLAQDLIARNSTLRTQGEEAADSDAKTAAKKLDAERKAADQASQSRIALLQAEAATAESIRAGEVANKTKTEEQAAKESAEKQKAILLAQREELAKKLEGLDKAIAANRRESYTYEITDNGKDKYKVPLSKGAFDINAENDLKLQKSQALAEQQQLAEQLKKLGIDTTNEVSQARVKNDAETRQLLETNLKAQLDKELALYKAQLDQRQAELDAALARNLISQEDYSNEVATINQDRLDFDIKQLKQQQDAIAQRKALTPSYDKQGQAQLDAEKTTLTAQEAAKTLEKTTTAAKDSVTALANAITASMDKAGRATDELARKEQDLADAYEAGGLTYLQQETQTNELRHKAAEAIKEQIDALQKLAEAEDNAKSPELLAKLAELNAKYKELSKTSDTVANDINKAFAKDAVEGIEALITKSKTLGDVLRSLMLGVVQQFQQAASKALQEMIFGYVGGSTGGLGGVLSSLLKYDTGGYTGPGGKYEVAGVVHKDEYVLRKEATGAIMSRYGVGFLEYMNRHGRLPGYGYAAGGLGGTAPLTTLGTASASPVRIVNALDQGSVHDAMATSGGERVILNVIKANAMSIKQAIR